MAKKAELRGWLISIMAHETEIKLRVARIEGVADEAEGLGARTVAARRSGRVHEWNMLFDTAAQDLRSAGQLLRIRVETPDWGGKRGARARRNELLFTFKGPLKVEMRTRWRDEAEDRA